MGWLSDSPQLLILKDCLARRLLSCHVYPELRNLPESAQGEELELADFSAFLAQEVWPTLPPSFREASFETRSALPDDLDSVPLDSTPVSFVDTLVSYGITADAEGAQTLLRKVLAEYVSDACAAPPVWSSTRARECEICEREIPLTYHHLIPRATHAKALKKKWHPASMLNAVAWLCRPCHTVVHQIATNEELARSYHSVDLLLEREDIQRWGKYASKQRFGVRRG
ncbi:hypothetical protein B0H15DRAFT_792009 [Mycena belliarum]|uniref:HNH domain-containing protein n=1 Tax=Mycena belliarum TaxID=1033014 RepID=A0AAD6TQ82_9AGAR|nr:hypothetical protein B0H15DRAFT_792009 [Mycena belliae]